MNYKIALIRGDGIGPEVVNEAGRLRHRRGGEELPRWHRRAVQDL